MVTVNPVVSKLAAYPAEALYAKRDALRAAGLEVFDFSVGDPIEPTDMGIATAFREGVPPVSQYPTIRGDADFRAAVCEWVARRFNGATLDADRELLPTRGSKEAIFHLPLTFLDPHGPRRRVLYGVPGYPVYERGTLFAGGEPWPVELRPETGYRLEPWELPADKIAETAILWLNYPHNPTAAGVDLAYLERVAAFCREHEILLCADECYVDMYFEEPKPPSVLELADRSGVLAFHSLSKRSGMTGYRSGFVAGDAELIALLAKTRPNFGVAKTVMVQRAGSWAWRDEAHAEARRQAFRAKRDAFMRFCAEVGLEHTPCTSTLYLWVRTPGDRDALGYAEALADRGILVSPAPFHGVEQPYVRIALVPSLADCERAIELWREFHTM
jgi:succinyldiaminopimelate transaminase